jgi:hypothetical protein
MFNINDDNSIYETKRENMKKARVQSNKTNKLKGLLTHINKANKQYYYKLQIYQQLEKTKYYEHIYNKYISTDEDIEISEIPVKDYELLKLFEFKSPDEIEIDSEN